MSKPVKTVISAASAALVILLGVYLLWNAPFGYFDFNNLNINNFQNLLVMIFPDVTYILLGSLCLAKLFIKKRVVNKCISIILAMCCLLAIYSSLTIFRMGTHYFVMIIKNNGSRLLLPELNNLLLYFVTALLCINILKPFFNKNVAVALCIFVCGLGLLSSLLSFLSVNAFSLRYFINTIIISLKFILIFVTMLSISKNNY